MNEKTQHFIAQSYNEGDDTVLRKKFIIAPIISQSALTEGDEMRIQCRNNCNWIYCDCSKKAFDDCLGARTASVL